ncbi:MAG: hypothetical protein A3E48_17600 [Rhodobacterales bacterium RIFCSPHIGHO2_12_FULL_62_75]|nr:MAG: hypothetical protein A3E48_17600 [Rhodobacterales bacterium RIFCSPHIGHO2_12_FULL_62_75]
MMRIIRQDAGFSAKLGFGGKVSESELADRPITVPPTSVDALAAPNPSAPALAATTTPSHNTGEVGGRTIGPKEEAREEEKAFGTQVAWDAKAAGVATGSAARGQVVHVSLSLTTRQARLAEEWATAARCTVSVSWAAPSQFLSDLRLRL